MAVILWKRRWCRGQDGLDGRRGYRAAMRRHGLTPDVDVPGEISVVGYDDSRLARLNLTTVAQDAARMARLAVAAVAARLGGDSARPPRDLLLDPHIIVRGTTGPSPV